MNLSKRRYATAVFQCTMLLAGFSILATAPLAAENPEQPRPPNLAAPGQRGWEGAGAVPACMPAALGSPYIPVDSWVYPAILRLLLAGFVDNVFARHEALDPAPAWAT